jgi:hypothetical protein
MRPDSPLLDRCALIVHPLRPNVVLGGLESAASRTYGVSSSKARRIASSVYVQDCYIRRNIERGISLASVAERVGGIISPAKVGSLLDEHRVAFIGPLTPHALAVVSSLLDSGRSLLVEASVPAKRYFGSIPSLVARPARQLVDGEQQIVVTFPDWRASSGPDRFLLEILLGAKGYTIVGLEPDGETFVRKPKARDVLDRSETADLIRDLDGLIARHVRANPRGLLSLFRHVVPIDNDKLSYGEVYSLGRALRVLGSACVL